MRLGEPSTAAGLSDWLWSTDRRRRLRSIQTATGFGLILAGVVVMALAAATGHASWAGAIVWSTVAMSCGLAFFALVRSGASEKFADPALTLPQIATAFIAGAAAYAISGAMRGTVLPLLMVALMFGTFSLRPRQVLQVAVMGALLLGLVMGLLAWRRPAQHPAAVELAHFLMLTAMLMAIAAIAHRLEELRRRLKNQRQELEEALVRIEFLATMDELTGLANRRQLTRAMDQEARRADRTGACFCVAILDLDHFKRVNDLHGHAAGDAALRHFAHNSARIVRATDMLGRWGGEEFLLLMPDSALPSAVEGAQRLRRALAQAPLQHEQVTLALTLSAGVAQYKVGESVQQTIERADAAMYRAKVSGRNRVECDARD
jgi:diguanylate cyclase (GGDEF)-like protein